MKILVSAIALAFAMPAAAQNAPVQPQHQQGGVATAPQADHSGHQMPAGKPHDQHQGHAMKDGCCADKDGNGKMDCCEKMAAKPNPDQPAQPQAHQNH